MLKENLEYKKVSNMTWKDVLKNLEINRDDMCCEEARVKIVDAFEKAIEKIGTPEHLDNMIDDNFRRFAEPYIRRSNISLDDFIKDYNKGNREALESTVTILSEESCDELYNSLERFTDMKDGFKRGWMADLFDYDELQDILADWDKCREEPTEDKQSKELPPQDLFDSNPAAWMSDYIRSR